jgi:hypothetical protein
MRHVSCATARVHVDVHPHAVTPLAFGEVVDKADNRPAAEHAVDV